ncbi:DnaD domain protein [Dielma fastidiosa]|uniref:DnaD/phage-associated family protein n=1 Tax=Dielma fastidiosa TaxID=1034346 RepID=A0A318KVQ9_9FIRM|nr:DnaD domain protein [Dielma fastidiosa]PXX79756.1 DnaD/phage-associated family protein [Dielma fastidiosa]
MAGKPKKKLDYAGWSVDLFDNDTKMDKLLDAQGWNGFGIYFYLCQKAYGSEGYFYKWGYDDCASTARKMGGGIGSGTVKETVDYCLQIGLFDKGLFDRWGVLTSKGIQRRYWAVASERRDKTVYMEYWLLQDEECKGCFKVALFDNYELANEHVDLANDHVKSLKESKVNKSKVKKSNERLKNIFETFEISFGNPLSQLELQTLHDWLNTFNDEVVLLALETAISKKAKSFKYINKVLADWQAAGIKDAESAKQHMKKRQKGTVYQKTAVPIPDWYKEQQQEIESSDDEELTPEQVEQLKAELAEMWKEEHISKKGK